jgi:hypothetical protein
VAACGKLGTDLNSVVALDVSLPDSGRVEVGDTLRPRARALDGHGDSVAATIVWARLDTTIQVVDSLTGATVGLLGGQIGRVQARVGNLRSNPLTLTVQSPLDSIAAGGPLRDTVTVSTPDSVSDSLRVQAYTTPSGALSQTGRVIALAATVYASGAATVTLVPGDTVRTNATGLAVLQVRFGGGVVPDSVVVTATARHHDGSIVPGSPVTFVVEFLP